MECRFRAIVTPIATYHKLAQHLPLTYGVVITVTVDAALLTSFILHYTMVMLFAHNARGNG